MQSLKQHLKRLRFALLAPSLTVNPHNERRAVVYVKSKLIYNRIKKSGNSSILLFLDKIVYGGPGSDSEDYGKAKAASLRRTARPFDLPSRELRQLSDYYKFTVFRNPYTRCLSMFLQKVATGQRAGYSFSPGFGEDTPEGFEKFVSFLEEGGITSNSHFFPQTDLLFFRPEDFSHIGKLEDLDAELRRVCNDVGLPYPQDLEASRPHRLEETSEGKVTRSSDKLKLYYTPSLFDRVRKLYMSDFEVGGYDTRPPI
jgi:hypothetical protein